MNKTAWIIIIIIGGGLIWWYLSMNSSYSMPAADQTPTSTTVPSAPTISLGTNAQFPSYLAAANGMTLYTFKSDTSGVSNCTGSCAVAWPPYTVASASGLSAGANVPGTISTITRSDGTLQVTYNGMPLYFFAQDTGPGDVTGNGLNGFLVAMAAAQPQATPQAVTPAAPAPYAAPTTPTPAPSTAPAYSY